MKTSMKMALAFTTLAGLATSAYAENSLKDNQDIRSGGIGAGMMSFEALDGDKTGDVTLEEFQKAAGDRFVLADANKDGKVTVEEMAAVIEKVRAERQAQRMIKRFDVDGDGNLTQAELETNQKEIYARLDKNNDGKLVAEELQRKFKKN